MLIYRAHRLHFNYYFEMNYENNYILYYLCTVAF
jgi:hypothetical protein